MIARPGTPGAVSDRLKVLEATNPLGLDAPALEHFRRALRRATPLLDKIFRRRSSAEDDTPLPLVNPTSDGELCVEWWSQDRKLTAYLGHSKNVAVRVWGLDVDTEMSDEAFEGAAALGELLDWVQASG